MQHQFLHGLCSWSTCVMPGNLPGNISLISAVGRLACVERYRICSCAHLCILYRHVTFKQKLLITGQLPYRAPVLSQSNLSRSPGLIFTGLHAACWSCSGSSDTNTDRGTCKLILLQDILRLYLFALVLHLIIQIPWLITAIRRQVSWSYAIREILNIFVYAAPPGLPTIMMCNGIITRWRLAKDGLTLMYPECLRLGAELEVACFDKTGTLTHRNVRSTTCVSHPTPPPPLPPPQGAAPKNSVCDQQLPLQLRCPTLLACWLHAGCLASHLHLIQFHDTFLCVKQMQSGKASLCVATGCPHPTQTQQESGLTPAPVINAFVLPWHPWQDPVHSTVSRFTCNLLTACTPFKAPHMDRLT